MAVDYKQVNAPVGQLSMDSLAFATKATTSTNAAVYANADTNYLLQLLEDYSGVALLATNKWSNVDGAFARRLRYLFVFPRPDRDERAVIWRRIVSMVAWG